MSILKQKAIKLIENMPEQHIEQAISCLENITSEKNDKAKRMAGLSILQSFAGTLPPNFNYKQELEEAREEKYDRFY